MKRFLIEFMFVNCKNESPTDAENNSININHQILKFRIEESKQNSEYPNYSPTRPNKTQYTAANIVKGIDANKAPNFPAST